ncbi:MAG TPA: gamma carbonic anhydrase family protein [Ktedonobacterales bacterium]|jgi:carbonic anhydrase/acetyltransferase-like protein (isoleucine patch superfamily)
MPVLSYQGKWPTIAPDVFLAEGAMVIGDVTIGKGSSIWYNTVLRGDTAPIRIGRQTNIQDNCTLHVDEGAPCVIGDECSIGHGAVVHGATLGDRVLIAMNAVVLSRAEIGSETMIGACALVGEGKQLAGGSLYVGIPAKLLRALSDAERADLPDRAARYHRYAAEHHISQVRVQARRPEADDLEEEDGLMRKIFRVFTG